MNFDFGGGELEKTLLISTVCVEKGLIKKAILDGDGDG